MAIIWNKIIPRWGGPTIEPPEAKKDEGYLIDDVPPASWENWLRKGTYEALDETRDVIESIDSQMAQKVSQTQFNELFVNADARNSIYRGKSLGSTYTLAQQQAVSSGTFEDMYIGDYWTIGGINYRIAAFNYYKNVGDTALTLNHITLVPDTPLYSAAMNTSNITTGGYVLSEMRTANLAAAITTIETAFPGHLVTHRQIFANAVTDGKASGWAWFDSKVDLMNEVMVYGSTAWGMATYGSGYNVGSGYGRLPLFALNHSLANTRQSYWLRNVVSATNFAHATTSGYTDANYASTSYGVRPAFSIS